ncbi:hypothetical protein DFH09DRAFT_1200099 [Mycena vulgaris]|nr:hypothetical protein DFH09DRAFT_1200099 [Mycena vulgaris]
MAARASIPPPTSHSRRARRRFHAFDLSLSLIRDTSSSSTSTSEDDSDASTLPPLPIKRGRGLGLGRRVGGRGGAWRRRLWDAGLSARCDAMQRVSSGRLCGSGEAHRRRTRTRGVGGGSRRAVRCSLEGGGAREAAAVTPPQVGRTQCRRTPAALSRRRQRSHGCVERRRGRALAAGMPVVGVGERRG